MSDNQDVLVVDRIEGGTAIVLDMSGKSYDVKVGSLPQSCRKEGRVFRATKARLEYDWKSAVWSSDEESRLTQELQSRLSKLRDRDPGGDVSL